MGEQDVADSMPEQLLSMHADPPLCGLADRAEEDLTFVSREKVVAYLPSELRI